MLHSWGRKELDMTERLNWTEEIITVFPFFKLGNEIWWPWWQTGLSSPPLSPAPPTPCPPWSHLPVYTPLYSTSHLEVGRTSGLLQLIQSGQSGEMLLCNEVHCSRPCCLQTFSSLSRHCWLWRSDLLWVLQLQGSFPKQASDENSSLVTILTIACDSRQRLDSECLDSWPRKNCER